MASQKEWLLVQTPFVGACGDHDGNDDGNDDGHVCVRTCRAASLSVLAFLASDMLGRSAMKDRWREGGFQALLLAENDSIEMP